MSDARFSCPQNPDWGVTVEPITSALTKVQGDQNNRLAQSTFKLVSSLTSCIILSYQCSVRCYDLDYIIIVGVF